MTTIIERPSLFSGPMVCAILEDRKTQTRRIAKGVVQIDQIASETHEDLELRGWSELVKGYLFPPCPFGKPGDRLWVRENFKILSASEGWDSGFTDDCECGGARIEYPADGTVADSGELIIRDDGVDEGKQAVRFSKHKGTVPSIHMPRWAGRIDLLITDIRVERLNAIREDDAKAEGPTQHEKWPDQFYATWKYAFRALWQSIYGPTSWDENPFVWVVEFERVQKQQMAA